MKRMMSFTRGVRSAYVLPQKGGVVIALLLGNVRKYAVFKINSND